MFNLILKNINGDVRNPNEEEKSTFNLYKHKYRLIDIRVFELNCLTTTKLYTSSCNQPLFHCNRQNENKLLSIVFLIERQRN